MSDAGRAPAFLKSFLAVAAALAAALYAAVLALDPYGIWPRNLFGSRPIMDINQRYMYPRVARSGDFDSIVIGTSTSRLLDPVALNAAFGGRFANLAMNAGTAWEQTELAKLYLRHNPAPRTIILGVDLVWCQPEGALERITFRGFPAWHYDDSLWNDLPHQFNLQTLEIAGRVALHHLGLMRERIRRDGFEVFTPPEASYDLARARWHIWRDRPGGRITPETPPVVLSEKEQEKLILPALEWLDDLMRAPPAATRRIIAFMPVHVAAQPTPGTREAAVMALCKTRIDQIARRHGATVVDFAIPSPITTEDSNYWDPLHYRLPIAGRIVAGIRAAAEGGGDDSEGVYLVRR